MSSPTKPAAGSARRKRASTSSSKDRPYVRRSKVKRLLEAQLASLQNELPKNGGGEWAVKFASNVLRGLLHDLEAL